jgi:hypothetical protein
MPSRARRWGWSRPFLAVVWLELRLAVARWPFAVLMLFWAAIVATEVFQHFLSNEYGTVLMPTTGLVVERLGQSLRLVGILLLVFYSAEMVWRERSAHGEEIVDATPASGGLFLAAKGIALALLLAALGAVGVGVSLVFQGSQGVAPDFAVYGGFLLFSGVPLLLLAALALFLQVLSPNRYVGILLTVVAILLFPMGVGGPEHPLLRYGVVPPVPYSALNGFSPAAGSFGVMALYWGGAAALLLVVSRGLWRRGFDTALGARLRTLPRRWGRLARGSAAGFGLLFLLTGALLFHQTHRVNAYQTADAVLDWKAEYESRYRHLESVPQPVPVAMETAVDLFPEARRYQVRGTYRLENRTSLPVEKIWIAVRRDIREMAKLTVAGVPAAEEDERFGMYAFPLPRPLAPGEGTELAFEFTVDRAGVSAEGADHDIVGNGSFLLSPFFLPTVGYRQSYELRDPAARRQRGLPESARPTTLDGVDVARADNAHRVRFEAVVSTAADQTALAPGALVEQWEAAGRRYFRYRMETPVTPYFAWVSARYAVARGEARTAAGNVAVEVYYHPDHGRNIDTYLQAAIEALEYCAREFGPYPHDHLRIVEIPAYWQRFAGLALPGMLYMVEDRGFLTDLSAPSRGRPRVDIVTKRIAHEVSHQWWGHLLTPANLPGASALVETPARYTELMILKEIHGEAAIVPALEIEMDRYLSGRGEGTEVPLYDVGDQAHIFYAKGALVMVALRDLIGEAAVNRALAAVLASKPDPQDQPTARDLLEALHREAPPEHHALIDQWWKEIVLYDLGLEAATVAPLPDGRFRVTVRVQAGKVAVREGEEVPLPLDEVLDFALYAQHPDGRGEDNVLRVEHRRVTGDGEVTWIVDHPPGYITIDPHLRRIDRDRADNGRRVVVRD